MSGNSTPSERWGVYAERVESIRREMAAAAADRQIDLLQEMLDLARLRAREMAAEQEPQQIAT